MFCCIFLRHIQSWFWPLDIEIHCLVVNKWVGFLRIFQTEWNCAWLGIANWNSKCECISMEISYNLELGNNPPLITLQLHCKSDIIEHTEKKESHSSLQARVTWLFNNLRFWLCPFFSLHLARRFIEASIFWYHFMS